jgi:hypothetical protein
VRISERLLTILVICLCIASVPAFANGKREQERQLKQAQALVDAKHYSQAMTLILSIMKEYPDTRESTDKLVARIMDVRKRFNEKVQELLDVLQPPRTPDKITSGLGIIADLKAIDPDSTLSPIILDAEQALENAQEFSRFETVMDAAAALLANRSYPEAIGEYRGAFFDTGYKSFTDAGYPPLLVAQVESVVRSLDTAARQAAEAAPALLAVPATLDALLARPLTAPAIDGFASSLTLLTQAADRETLIRTTAERIRALRGQLSASQGGTQKRDLWLRFIAQFALANEGPPSFEERTREGIAYAARAPWVDTARALSDTVAARAETSYGALDTAFTAAVPLSDLHVLAEETRRLTDLAIRVMETEAPAWQPAAGLQLSDEEAARAAKLAEITGIVRQHAVDADAWEAFTVDREQAVAAFGKLEKEFTGIRPPSSDAAALREGRNQVRAVRETASSTAEAWNKRTTEAATGSAMAAQAAGVRERYAGLVPRTLVRDAELANQIAALETAGYPERLANARTRQEKGTATAAGTWQGIKGKRPDLALLEYEGAIKDIGTLLSDINGWISRWSSEPSYVSDGDAMKAQAKAMDDFLNAVIKEQNSIAVDAANARTQLSEGTRLSGEGDKEKTAADAEAKASRYDKAKAGYLTALNDFYKPSLDRLESVAVQDRIDEIDRILSEIDGKIEDQVRKEANALFGQAREALAIPDYPRALALLDAADETLGNLDPDTTGRDINYYKGIVASQQRLSGRRQIDRTDPIFQEISGFMAQAELSYAEAARLRKTAPTSAAYQVSLVTARESVTAIGLIVQEYQKARLLSLNIDRLDQGDAKFRTSYRSLVEAALKKAKDLLARPLEEVRVLLNETLLTLQDYRDLPDAKLFLTADQRKRIASTIDDITWTLEPSLKPIPQKTIDESNSLFTQANALYAKNKSADTQWDPALRKLRESLTKWPANTRSQNLQSEIIAKRHGDADLMDAAQAKEYQRARDLYALRDYPSAQFIVEKLLTALPKNPILKRFLDEVKTARGQG